ncbi:hypothetical protein IX51_11455 [uncultured archaeon]|nr:hypothetical protein IX51_11455 [uncultured archaeon]HKJ97179.1 NAD(P)/FAD-dependent oxidoreductase [Thermoplasmataceae archaeon]
MTFDYDAIVIGAGTGGLSAGISLKRGGSKYLILDKKEEIGVPVRSTGAVSIEWVNRIGMPTDKSIVRSFIKGIDFRTDRGKKISLTYDHPVGLVYDFTTYEKFLAEKFAGDLNINLKTRVTSIEGNVVRTEDGELTAENIIMAAGPQSSFGDKLSRDNVLVAYEEVRELPARDDFEMILWFSDNAPGGYFWDFADTDSTRKIGVCYYPLSPSKPKDVLANFTKQFPEVDGKAVSTIAHQIPLGPPASTVVKGNRLFVGDMINAVLNTTAGGLQGAFWSGIEAGKAAVRNDPAQYQNVWDEKIRPWLLKHHELHRRMHRKGAKSIGRLMSIARVMPKSMQKKVFGGL